jgi:SAM-dependent methyltransferase
VAGTDEGGISGAPRGDNWSSGDLYEPYVGRWSRLVGSEFLRWLAAPAGGRWLDVGCGTGALAQTILSSASPLDVVGVDPSPGYVAHVEQRTADARARFEVGDAQALSFPDESFDYVVSGLVMNFIPDRARALREMRRVVRSEGIVAAYVWDYPGEMQLMRFFWDTAVELDATAEDLHEGRRFSFCQPDGLVALLSEAGFTQPQVREIVVPTRFEDFNDYWTPFLGGQAPAPSYLASLGEEGRAALRDSVRRRLPIADDGSISLTARAWAIRGRP